MTGETQEGLTRAIGELADPLPIPVWTRSRGAAPLDVTIRPPGSKSLTNRLLLLGALTEGRSVLRGALLDADDPERMIEAVRTLGATVDRSPAGDLTITGVGGRWRVPEDGLTVNLNNAGTATRFLAASALLASGPLTIDGNDRMRQRPIGELTTALESLGARVEFVGEPGCPPVRITPPAGNILSSNSIELGTTQSSQFISGLLLAAPFVPGGLTLQLTGEITSQSYVRMTVDLLDLLGASVRSSADLRVIRVAEGLGRFEVEVEPDASAATYWFAAGLLLPRATVRVDGLVRTADEPILQGDSAFPDELARLGGRVIERGPTQAVRGSDRLSGIMADLSDMPDAAMTMAVCCSFAQGTSVLKGVRTLRVKECDRIAALETELGKLGVEVRSNVNGDDDVMTITPPKGGVDCSAGVDPVEFETYGDHRMAMALSLVGLRRPGVSIKDPCCVGKTYPGFFADLARLYDG